MPARKHIIGKTFGRLVVLGISHKHITLGGYVVEYMDCICSCTPYVKINRNSLLNGKTHSCGCLQRERASKKNSKKWLGKRFGRLVVLEKHHRDKNYKLIEYYPNGRRMDQADNMKVSLNAKGNGTGPDCVIDGTGTRTTQLFDIINDPW